MVPRNTKQHKHTLRNVTLATVTTLATAELALFIAIDKQPAKAPENTFEAKTTQTTKQKEVKQDETNQTTTDANPTTNSDTVEQGTVTEWDVAEDYTTLKAFVGAQGYFDAYGNKLNRSGFYVVNPVQDPMQSKYICVDVIEYDLRTNDTYIVTVSYHAQNMECQELYEKTMQKAVEFVEYMRSICPEGHTIHGLQSNYDLWDKDVFTVDNGVANREGE